MYRNEMEEEDDTFCAACWNSLFKTITIECGHCVCLSCLRKNKSRSFCCPTCWDSSQLRILREDVAMHPEGEGMCELHREDQKLFCEIERELLCVSCSKTEDHEAHIHWPIEVAAVGYRKMIQTDIINLGLQVKEIQGLQCREKRPLVWVVVWADDIDITRKDFKGKMQAIWEYLKEKDNTERTEVGEIIMETGNEEFIKLYQRLKEMETAQQQDIMEKKREWEAMMFQRSQSLEDKIRELEEKSQKSNVELLQDVSNSFERAYIEPNLKPFIPCMDISYLNAAIEFLKHFHTSGLPQTCNSYNISEEKRSTITFVPDSSGKTYSVYTTGSLQADSVSVEVFLMRKSRTIKTFWNLVFED